MPDDVEVGYNRPQSPEHYPGWKPWIQATAAFGKVAHTGAMLADHGLTSFEAANRPEPFFMYLAFNAPHDP